VLGRVAEDRDQKDADEDIAQAADVLSDNLPMLKILGRGGFRAVASRERGTKQLALQLK
jgi:hypothetical protein